MSSVSFTHRAFLLLPLPQPSWPELGLGRRHAFVSRGLGAVITLPLLLLFALVLILDGRLVPRLVQPLWVSEVVAAIDASVEVIPWQNEIVDKAVGGRRRGGFARSAEGFALGVGFGDAGGFAAFDGWAPSGSGFLVGEGGWGGGSGDGVLSLLRVWGGVVGGLRALLVGR